jgi:putative nucleotidyltransferase with HDIG domain/excisionase family DNA binding protein
MKDRMREETYFTPKQAAECFNLSLSTIKNYIYAGKLKTLTTPGGHHRILKSELLATLGGEMDWSLRKSDTLDVMEVCSGALLNVFKALGHSGDFLIVHSRNVGELCYKVSRSMHLAEREARKARIAGFLHDIGHVGSDKSLVSKRMPVTGIEYESLKEHVKIGEDILYSSDLFKDIARIVGQHHERPDGTGYPNAVKGDRIDKLSSIVSIAEAYDVMVSSYYRNSMSKEDALQELLRNKGIQFDGELVDAFIRAA